MLSGYAGPMIQTITKDTIIKSRLAKELVQDYYADQKFNNLVRSDTFYISHDNNQLLVYRGGSFYTFFDKRWDTGDTAIIEGLNYSCLDSSGNQRISSTGMHVAYGKQWNYTSFDQSANNEDWQITSSYFYSLFGGENGWLPSRTCIIDGGYNRMVCYKDKSNAGIFLNQFGEILDTVGVCDPYSLTVNLTDPLHNMKPYVVNWRNNDIIIYGPSEVLTVLEIATLSGRRIYHSKATLPILVDMPFVSSGIYIVNVYSVDGTLLKSIKSIKP